MKEGVVYAKGTDMKFAQLGSDPNRNGLRWPFFGFVNVGLDDLKLQ